MTDGIEEFTLLPPGQLLQHKRRELNLSTGEVASMLLLSKTQIKALEAGDHQDLASVTYVIGYWRNYARLLKIDIDDSIKIFKDSIDEDSHSTTRIRDNHRQAHSHQEKSRKLTAISFLVLAILCLIAIWFWQSSLDDSPFIDWQESLIQDTDQSSAPDGDSPVELPVTEQTQTANSLPQSVLPEPNFLERGTDLPTITRKPVDDVLQSDVPDDSDVPEVSDASEVSDVSDITDGVAEDTIDTASTQPASEDVDASSRMPLDERIADTATFLTSSANVLKINVLQNCWLDVRDQSGEKLIFRTAEAGELVTLTGLPPFAVFVENSEYVSIEYLGKSVPIEPYVDNERYARFLLGEAAESGR